MGKKEYIVRAWTEGEHDGVICEISFGQSVSTKEACLSFIKEYSDLHEYTSYKMYKIFPRCIYYTSSKNKHKGVK